MHIARRQFMQLGAMALVAEGGCCLKVVKTVGSATACTPPNVSANTLAIDFQGLYIVEKRNMAMMIHLVDASAVHLPHHLVRLKAMKSTIDTGQTTAVPSQKNPSGGDEEWVFELAGRHVTAPPPAGANSLAGFGTSSDDNQEIPTSDAGWDSGVRVADLGTCCGATAITNLSAMTSSIELTQGSMHVLNPCNIGGRAVWQFTGPHSQVLMKRALSDKVRYLCPTGGSPVAVRIDGEPIVFNGGGGQVRVENVPEMGDHGGYREPKMSHFPAFYNLVDSRIKPDICLASWHALEQQEAGSDYCPGGQI